MTNFTPEQLIAYHYQELPAAQHAEIADALQSNWVLQEKYRVISDASHQLDKAMMAPRHTVVQALLAYGKAQFVACLSDN